MNHRRRHFVPHLRAISVQFREIFVMVTKLKKLISVDFRQGVIFGGIMNSVVYMGSLCIELCLLTVGLHH